MLAAIPKLLMLWKISPLAEFSTHAWKLVVLAAVITPWDNRETPWDPPERRDFVYWRQGFTVSQPWANREPTVSQQWLMATLCVSGGIDTRMMMVKHTLYLINMCLVSTHEHENDDDKIYTLIWRCMHVVVLPCLSCTSWFNYVFRSPGIYIYIYTPVSSFVTSI